MSSAAAHVHGQDDRLVRVAPMLKGVDDWSGFLSEGSSVEAVEEFRRHERSGRPLGSERFVAQLEALLGGTLRSQERGPKGPRRRRRRARN